MKKTNKQKTKSKNKIRTRERKIFGTSSPISSCCHLLEIFRSALCFIGASYKKVAFDEPEFLSEKKKQQ